MAHSNYFQDFSKRFIFYLAYNLVKTDTVEISFTTVWQALTNFATLTRSYNSKNYTQLFTLYLSLSSRIVYQRLQNTLELSHRYIQLDMFADSTTRLLLYRSLWYSGSVQYNMLSFQWVGHQRSHTLKLGGEGEGGWF